MVYKATIPIAVQPGTRLLQLRYDAAEQCYILWLHHDLAMRNGTFLKLFANGKVQRVTARPDGSEEVHDVT